MRVALVHDWLTGMRGGERVLERVCRRLPGAVIHTILWNKGSVSADIEAHPIRTSFVQRLPAAARGYRWYLPVFPRAIEGFDLSGFDAVLSFSHCAAKGVRVPAGTYHLSYVFTPMRYIWELEAQYFPPGRFPWPLSAYVRGTCARLRAWDVLTSGAPNEMIAISHHVAARIARHYGREAPVIYPPVELDRFTVGTGARDYYLLAGAMAPYKRADVALEACRRMGRRLVVVGTGQEEERLKRLAHGDVEFKGWVADEDMPALYRGARALLFPGEEDFGIVPVEAMASGCPVIAFGQGGALETVGRDAPPEAMDQVARGGSTIVPGGALFGAQSAEGLIEAMERVERHAFDPHALAERARPFAAEEFDRRFFEAFERGYADWRECRSS
jgi:glycosyltransferase involved in cell wall biosynthesis